MLRPGVVITGMGAVSPLGVGVEAYVRGCRIGRSGVRRLTFSDHRIRSTVAATCPEFDPGSVMPPAEQARVPRLIPMALAACREAMARAGLDASKTDTSDTGLFLGTGAGGIDFTLDQSDAGHAGRRPSLWTITNATHGNLAGELSIGLGLHGPSMCVSDGCASASDAVGLAMELLRSPRPGAPSAMVVVGADAHVRWETLLGMELLRVISTRDFSENPEAAPTAARPFDATRDGFVLGEGAWAVMLEREDHAAARGAKPVGRMLGYGATCDAFHRVRPAPDMAESARAIRLAIADAGLEPDAIEMVHYHGTATKMNDELETLAVKLAFGEHARRLIGHSVKGAIGHPQGACGLAALVCTLGALTGADGGEPFAPPTINLRERDEACDLDYTPLESRPTRARVALINCLAFGAKNSALVVGAAEAGIRHWA
ncbi:MAG: beta-ketoacyl synthase [Tepidisphaera sp.]|nr:beta-ketoacyl synthase [Tepidisphaera sp.]